MKKSLAIMLAALLAFASAACLCGSGIVAHADDPEFIATVKVTLADSYDSNELYYGDKVELAAIITDANMPYTIIWQAYDGKTWTDIQEGGLRYRMELTPESVSLSYRVVLVAEEAAE